MKLNDIKKHLNTLKDLNIEVLIIAIEFNKNPNDNWINKKHKEIKEFNNYFSEAGAYKFNENDMFNYEKLALVENKYDRTIY